MTENSLPPRVIEQRGLYFEELEEGVVYAHRPGRTVTEADNVLFTTLTMNAQALHLDAAWSAGQPFGQRLVNSMFTLATMVGQSVSQLTQGTIIAQLGLTDVSFPHPLYHGDTLYTETVITRKRLSDSRPGQGIVTMAHTGRNQDGTVVALASRSCLMWTRGAHAERRGDSAAVGRQNSQEDSQKGEPLGARTGDNVPMTFVMGPSLLFCPADRPDRYQKAAESADAVILDLEDAVAPGDKQRARGAILAQLGSAGDVPELDPSRTIVRINPAGTEEFEKDLHCLAHTPYKTLMLAKAESADQLKALGDYHVIALCETAAGVLNAPAIAAAPNVVALMWGAEDLLASLGGTSSRNDDGGYRAVAVHARSAVLLAARAVGKEAVDAVYVNIPDLEGLSVEASDAVGSGFSSKACIHPTQAAVVRNAYEPSAADVAAATELLQAAAAAGKGVFQYNGKMVDGPILKHAESVIRRAGARTGSPLPPR